MDAIALSRFLLSVGARKSRKSSDLFFLLRWCVDGIYCLVFAGWGFLRAMAVSHSG